MIWLRAVSRDAGPCRERPVKDTAGAAMHWWETEPWEAGDLKTKKSFWLIKRIDIFKKKNGRAINNDFINICFFRFCTFYFAQISSQDAPLHLTL